MKAIYKCRECTRVFSTVMEDCEQDKEHCKAHHRGTYVNGCHYCLCQRTHSHGLMFIECPMCKSLYADCQNLAECLEWCEKAIKLELQA